MKTVRYKGQELTLTQDAYLTQNDNGTYYAAHAVDSQKNEYMVRWEITHENPRECDNESDMCDWDNYIVTGF